jgi:hypothetical protein
MARTRTVQGKTLTALAVLLPATVKTPIASFLTGSALASALASAFLAGRETVAAAANAFQVAKASTLTGLAAVLVNQPPMSEAQWLLIAPDVMASFIASGKYKIDVVATDTTLARSLSASTAVSTVKVAVLGLTNDFEPIAADGTPYTSLAAYVADTREELKTAGILADTTQGAKTKSEERKSTDKADKADKAIAARAEALKVVAWGDKGRAANLAWATDKARVLDFDQWVKGAIAAEVAKGKASA